MMGSFSKLVASTKIIAVDYTYIDGDAETKIVRKIEKKSERKKNLKENIT